MSDELTKALDERLEELTDQLKDAGGANSFLAARIDGERDGIQWVKDWILENQQNHGSPA